VLYLAGTQRSSQPYTEVLAEQPGVKDLIAQLSLIVVSHLNYHEYAEYNSFAIHSPSNEWGFLAHLFVNFSI
jgi:hypothetical protein